MGNIFAASEIIELGIQIEKNGKDFYDTLAGQSKNQKAIQIFKYLSNQEDLHISVFKKMLDSVQGYEPAESYTGEYAAYMSALASEHIFTQAGKGIEIARRVVSDKEAVELGLGFEKDSIIFYEGMKKMVPEYDQKIIQELIQQEQGHLTQLSEFKKFLN
jgi:rubrerythrin